MKIKLEKSIFVCVPGYVCTRARALMSECVSASICEYVSDESAALGRKKVQLHKYLRKLALFIAFLCSISYEWTK